MAPDTTTIINAEALTSIFGEWPSFHDAEVHAIRLSRGPGAVTLEADIQVFRYTGEVTDAGFIRQEKQTLVTLGFDGIDQLQLEGFNHQNAVFDVVLRDIRDRQLELLKWEVEFQSSWGVGAKFFCQDVTVLGAVPLTI